MSPEHAQTNRGLKLPGSLTESGTRLLMGCKEHLHEWMNSDGRMVLKIQREAHVLQRAIVLDSRGQSFPMLVELVGDRSDWGARPRPQHSSIGSGLHGIAVTRVVVAALAIRGRSACDGEGGGGI